MTASLVVGQNTVYPLSTESKLYRNSVNVHLTTVRNCYL